MLYIVHETSWGMAIFPIHLSSRAENLEPKEKTHCSTRSDISTKLLRNGRSPTLWECLQELVVSGRRAHLHPLCGSKRRKKILIIVRVARCTDYLTTFMKATNCSIDCSFCVGARSYLAEEGSSLTYNSWIKLHRIRVHDGLYLRFVA
jgi:hypothetical protein